MCSLLLGLLSGSVKDTFKQFRNANPNIVDKVCLDRSKRSIQSAKQTNWKLPLNPLNLKIKGTRWEFNIYHPENEMGHVPAAKELCAKLYHQPNVYDNLHIFATKYTAKAAANSLCVAFICDGTAKCTPTIGTVVDTSHTKQMRAEKIPTCQNCNEQLEYMNDYAAKSISIKYDYGFECNNCGKESESKFYCYHCPKCSDEFDLCQQCVDLQLQIKNQTPKRKSKLTNSLHKTSYVYDYGRLSFP